LLEKRPINADDCEFSTLTDTLDSVIEAPKRILTKEQTERIGETYSSLLKMVKMPGYIWRFDEVPPGLLPLPDAAGPSVQGFGI